MNNPLLLVIGLVFIVLGFIVGRLAKAKKGRCTAAATGTVTAVKRHRSANEDGKDSYYPTYSFTVNGQQWDLEGEKLLIQTQ